MNLLISTAAAPGVAHQDLLDAATRRGVGLIDVHAIDADALILNAAKEDVYTAFMRSRPATAIVLRGGGPEAAFHEGRGIGALMAQLALDGFSGDVVLEPSSSAALPVWHTWLMARKNWGCGSKQQDPSLVQLT